MNNDPLSVFMQGLVSGAALAGDPVNVEIVPDNCGKLSNRARDLVRLSYRSSVSQEHACSRWDAVKRPESPPVINSSEEPKVFPILPAQRSSSGAGDDSWKSPTLSCNPVAPKRRSLPVDKIPNLPPRDPAMRSSLRWSLALDASDRDISKIRDHFAALIADDDDMNSDDDSDSEIESCCSASVLDFNDYVTDDSDSEDEDDDDEEEDFSFNDSFFSRWASEDRGAPHEWKFPANSILPNIQTLVREAAQSKDLDINKRIRSSLTLSPVPGNQRFLHC